MDSLNMIPWEITPRERIILDLLGSKSVGKQVRILSFSGFEHNRSQKDSLQLK